ncbi:MAG: hypothetical protein H6822_24960 [Planctomycetaceae bacterium]|nr:hypothetical protein [Planctomycetaceae bacterium]
MLVSKHAEVSPDAIASSLGKTAVETHPDSRPSTQKLGSLSLCRSDIPESAEASSSHLARDARQLVVVGAWRFHVLITGSKTTADAASNQWVQARAGGARISHRAGSRRNFPDPAGVVEILTSTRSISGSVRGTAHRAAVVAIS